MDYFVHEDKVLIFVIQKKFKRVACFDSLSTREDYLDEKRVRFIGMQSRAIDLMNIRKKMIMLKYNGITSNRCENKKFALGSVIFLRGLS